MTATYRPSTEENSYQGSVSRLGPQWLVLCVSGPLGRWPGWCHLQLKSRPGINSWLLIPAAAGVATALVSGPLAHWRITNGRNVNGSSRLVVSPAPWSSPRTC